jgi:acetylornithine deacetylase/succinyl-diaminopimelate desuccinylase-like protein
MTRQTSRPTCDVNGITCGYQGEGGKTIIPARASFKVSMRLVANQDPADIAAKFKMHVARFASPTAEVRVNIMSSSYPVELPLEGQALTALNNAFEETWGKKPLLCREGGSVPVIGMFQRELGLPIVNFPLSKGTNAHAPNEYYDLTYLKKNLATAAHFYYHIS